MNQRQRVDGMTSPLQVGQPYLVRCVWGAPLRNMPAHWVPVMGPLHEDAEYIKFPYDHWHIDFRFVTDRQYERYCDGVFGMPESPLFAVFKVDHVNVYEKYLQLVSRREMPKDPAVASFMPALEEAYARTRLKTCKTCPHRGMPLATIPVNSDGTVTCPGHGLRWDCETGELRPRGLVR